MGFFDFGKKKNIVGLDIGSSAIKAVELKPLKGGGFQVINLGIEPLIPEAIVDGTILDSAVVIDAITNLFQEANIKTKDVATAVSGNAVIIKKITLPLMTEEELSESIQWEAEQYIPFDIEDVNIDYQILGETAENMDVLLVAVKKDKINDYTQVVSQAGLNPVIVEVDSFAMQNCFEQNYESSPDETIALVNLGASIMNINILRDGGSVFWRDIGSGGNKFTEEIQRELHVSQEQAEAIKRGETVEGVSAASAAPILAQVTTELATEIQKTFDFFMATSSTDRIHRIVLSGGTAKIDGLEAALSEKFGATVEFLNPFEQMEIVGKSVDEDQAAEDGASYAIAAGLATRSLSDPRINLLRERREGGAAAGPAAATSMPGEGFQPIYAAFALILLLAVGYIGVDFMRLRSDINGLESEKTRLEAEKRRLEPILQEKKELEKKREALDRKISIIRELKAAQLGPVMLLDELSKNLPDYVWLRSLSESTFQVRLDGFALNANKVADFVENLSRSGRFKIIDPPSYTTAPGPDGRSRVSFRMSAQFILPTSEADEATAAQTGAGQ